MCKTNKHFSVLALLLFLYCGSAAQVKRSAVVAADGSGDYVSIQAAVDAAPANSDKPHVIFIKKGIYREKVYIEKSNLVLAGEDRDSTVIVYPELRRNWHKEHPGNDWGSAVVNLGNEAVDITIVNLNIYNDYGSVYADDQNAHDHQFAIRGGGSRVSIINCILKADGGDTVSLWNSINGMYYLTYCKFEGWVDYVCPRGWCYISDSEFFGHNFTASIWHDGSMDESQKFVIKNCSFDGVKGFPLGRNHRDAQFYLINCRFSENMADRPIYRAKDDSLYQWPERCYYYNCSRDGGNFSWFNDNLESADLINAEWTFGGRWNPEVIDLPIPCSPFPTNNSVINNGRSQTLGWRASSMAVNYIVNVSEGDKPIIRIRTGGKNNYTINNMRPGFVYKWSIDILTGDGIIVKGPVWIFSVAGE